MIFVVFIDGQLKYCTLIQLNTIQVYLIQIVPSHVHYMLQPVLRPFSGMSIQISYKGRCNKIEGPPLVNRNCFYNVKTYNIRYNNIRHKQFLKMYI